MAYREEGVKIPETNLVIPCFNEEQEVLLCMARYYFSGILDEEAILEAPIEFIEKLSENFPTIRRGTIVVTPFGKILLTENPNRFIMTPPKH